MSESILNRCEKHGGIFRTTNCDICKDDNFKKLASEMVEVGTAQERGFVNRIATLTAELAAMKAERDAALQGLAETNSAFSEAVHMHQQERAALSALLERVTAERDAALKRLNTITKSAYLAGDGWRIGAAFPAVDLHKLSGLSKADFYAAVDAAREG